MRTDSDDYKMTPFNMVMKYIGIAVAIIYIGVGIAIALRSQGIFSMNPRYAILLGGLFIVYGVFRAYRVFSKHFQK